jgi:hypothetical protein
VELTVFTVECNEQGFKSKKEGSVFTDCLVLPEISFWSSWRVHPHEVSEPAQALLKFLEIQAELQSSILDL